MALLICFELYYEFLFNELKILELFLTENKYIRLFTNYKRKMDLNNLIAALSFFNFI